MYTMIVTILVLAAFFSLAVVVACVIDRGLPEVVRGKRKRRLLSASVCLVIIGVLLAFVVGGPMGQQHREAIAAQDATNREADISRIVSFSERAFMNPLSEQDAEALLAGGSVNVPIASPDGSTRGVEFVTPRSLPGFSSMVALVPADEREQGWNEADGKLQRTWVLQARVVPELERAYGVTLTPEQVTALKMPDTEPSTFMRYGSTELAKPLGDGTYFNGVVTLIWDGEFKLIGSEGTDRAQELPRK